MKKTNSEYAASHSVDTSWYAVDKDGNLGFMDASEDGAIPVTVSEQHVEDELYELHCLMDISRKLDDNCYSLYAPNEEDIENCKKLMKERWDTYPDSKNYWWEWGMIILTNGISVKELSLWTNRPKDAVCFFFNNKEDLAIIFNVFESENMKNDLNSGLLVCFDYFENGSLGEPYEGLRSYGEYYSWLPDTAYQIRIKSLNKETSHVTNLDVSFASDKTFCLYDKTYAHNPGPTDLYPLPELREKFSKMSQKERECELFDAIAKAGDKKGKPYCHNTERIVGLLLKEYEVSPFAKNHEGVQAIDFAYSTFGDKRPIVEDDYYNNASICIIIKMLELKKKELCNK